MQLLVLALVVVVVLIVLAVVLTVLKWLLIHALILFVLALANYYRQRRRSPTS